MSDFSSNHLHEWLSYFENRPSAEIQLGLDRIRAVAEKLQVLTFNAVVISIAGTNGKGSTVATLETIYSEAGYKVGAYTSPHLVYFNERIRLNGQNIPDAVLCELFTQIENIRKEIHLTYFEMATLAALLYFKQNKPDVILLEVGVGGRLDATNIIDADLSIITTIDFDHQDLLGHTLEEIAYEKAGILRPNQWFIYADQNMPNRILQCALDLKVNMRCINQHYWFEQIEDEWLVSVQDENIRLLPPNVHPHAAAAGIVATQCLANRLPISSEILRNSFKKIKIAGRQQIIYDTMCIVLDVSHNPQSVNLLSERMKSLIHPDFKGKVHAVFSGLKDKAINGLIEPMLPWIDHWYTAVLESKRAASIEMLKETFHVNGIIPMTCDSITEAYQAAKKSASLGDVIVVYGSFLVVSPIILTEGWICNGSANV